MCVPVCVCVYMAGICKTNEIDESKWKIKAMPTAFFFIITKTIVSEKSFVQYSDIHIHARQIYRWFL